jgi:hypothetical protein
VQTITFAAAGSQMVTTGWPRETTGSHWFCVRTVTPNVVVSNQANLTLTCEPVSMPPPLILKKPDLVIEDIWVSGGKIWYRIKNNGSLASNPSTSQLYIDDLLKQSDAVPSLAAGASSNESFPAQWICVLDSTHTLKVRADTTNTNFEWNEDNNALSETYTCH